MSNDTPTPPFGTGPDGEPKDEPESAPVDDPRGGPDDQPNDGPDEAPTNPNDAPDDTTDDTSDTDTDDAETDDAETDESGDAATVILPAQYPIPPRSYPAPESYAPTTPYAAPTPYVPPTSYVPPASYVPPEAPTPPTVPPTGAPPTKKKNTLLYWLIGIGAVLLIAVIVLLVWLFSAGDNDTQPTATPSASETPSEEPSPTPEPSKTPSPSPTPTTAPVASPTFATFTAPTAANCQEGDDDAPLSFSWSSSDAVRAYLGVGTQNAAINPTISDLPPTATYTDLTYDCSIASQVYTVTLEDEAGALASKTVTITK